MCEERKPWMDENGNVYSNAKLKEIQESWDLGTWEDFLQSEVEVPRQESLLTVPEALENFSNGYGDMVRDEDDRVQQFPRMERQIRSYLSRLSAKEQRIVRYLFWDGMSQREIAVKCKMSRTAVVKCRDRALKRLGEFFVEDLTQHISANNSKKAKGRFVEDSDLLGA